MLCPNCVRDVPAFPRVDAEAGAAYRCPAPECGQPVALRYVQECLAYPPVVFSLIGYRGHGKTVYLSSLLDQFERIGSEWRDFTYSAVDETALKEMRKKQRELREGQIPVSTPVNFREPIILRLGKTRVLGACHLLAYDGGGEAFEEVSKFKVNRNYLCRSPAVVWLVSLSDFKPGAHGLESPQGLVDMLTRYVQAVLEMGGDPRTQKLLVVLTKGDLLKTMNGAPEALLRYLDGQGAGVNDDPGEELVRLSTALESWLDATPHYLNFVRLARTEFAAVRYCAVSALGAAPRGDRLDVQAHPRGVLGPLYWLQSFLLPRVNVQAPGRAPLNWWSLEDAAASAPPGAILQLSAGTHYLSRGLRLTQPLHLHGAGSGPGGTQIAASAEDFVVAANGSAGLSAQDVAFVHLGQAPAHVVWASDAAVDLQRCRFAGAVAGPQPQPRGGCGLLLTGRSAGTVAGCEFTDNRLSGVLLTDQACAHLQRNTVEGSDWGVVYSGAAAGAAQLNVCRKNRRSGIRVDRHAVPRLESNLCSDNGEFGIEIAPYAQPVLTGNRCENNRGGEMNDQRPTLSHSARAFWSSLFGKNDKKGK